ncbi:MAG: stage III sporulation protein AA [Bacillota bacterium]
MNRGSLHDILKYMPNNLSTMLLKLPENIKENIEEVRLRVGRPLIAAGGGSEYLICAFGCYDGSRGEPYLVTTEDVRSSVQLISNFSLYSVEEEIKNGYITVGGGHRVGLCGRVILDGNKIRTIKDISFLNYRIAKQIIGAADKVMGYIIRSPDSIYNTLIISPPQCGKTTLLRDIVRQLSNGLPGYNLKGKKIGLVDERNEIAACSFGKPRNDLGIRTDVMDSCPKAEGIIMMIRSMSPDIIATDEIGRKEDAEAIIDAINAGVKVISTIHGNDIEDFMRKGTLECLRKDLFERIIILSRSNGVGTIEKVYGENYRLIFKNSRNESSEQAKKYFIGGDA